MQRSRDDIVSALERKGFQRDTRDHEYFIYWNKAGKKTIKKTKVSLGTSHKSIGDSLIGAMSRQVGLKKKLFIELVDCTLNRDQYELEAFPPSPK